MSDELEPVDLKALATLVRRAIYNAYDGVLIGNCPAFIRKNFERMTHPQVGDLVIEASTVRMPYTNDLNGVGVLEKITQEPFPFDEPWDEAAEGRPWPKEQCYYFRTFDGRLFRWTNARVIAALSTFRAFA